MLKNILYTCILLSVIACNKQKFLDLDGLEFQENLYVSGDVSPDSIYVFITRNNKYKNQFRNTINPTDTSAIVEVYEDGEYLCRLKYIKGYDNYLEQESLGYFVSDKKATPGKTYLIKVFHKEKEMSATVKIPVNINFTTIRVAELTEKRNVIQTDSFGISHDTNVDMNFFKFGISFHDPQYENNFYVCMYKDYNNSWHPSFYDEPIAEVIPEKYGFRETKQVSIFSDKLINGKPYEFVQYLYKEFKDTFHIRLLSITEDTYRHTKAWNDYVANKKDVYAEPVIPYYNVKNGLGYISGYSYSEVILYPGGKYEIVK